MTLIRSKKNVLLKHNCSAVLIHFSKSLDVQPNTLSFITQLCSWSLAFSYIWSLAHPLTLPLTICLCCCFSAVLCVLFVPNISPSFIVYLSYFNICFSPCEYFLSTPSLHPSGVILCHSHLNLEGLFDRLFGDL